VRVFVVYISEMGEGNSAPLGVFSTNELALRYIAKRMERIRPEDEHYYACGVKEFCTFEHILNHDDA
jgi:hypothetical protein